MSETPAAPSSDFDFLMGTWKVRHRRLKRRLAQSTDWAEFSGTSVARKILAGFGNIDENEIDLPGDPYIGVTLRTYDPRTRNWAIHWFDSRDPGRLEAPMIGRFEKGIGTFFADQQFNGRPVRVRFIWSRVTPQSCRWEQAFSTDGGTSWETNWIMDFARV
jgi:hypothetical protein